MRNILKLSAIFIAAILVIMFAFNICGLRSRIFGRHASCKYTTAAGKPIAKGQLDRMEGKLDSVKTTGEDTNVVVRKNYTKIGNVGTDVHKVLGTVVHIDKTTNKIAKKLGGITSPSSADKKTTSASESSSATTAGSGKEEATAIGKADELWIEIQTGLAGGFIEKEGSKGNRKHVCHGVRTLLANESVYKSQFSYDNWENGVMGAKKAYCQKKVNIVMQKTLRNITQGSCANYVFDKLIGHKGECNFSLAKIGEGYMYLTAGTYGITRALPKGSVKRTVAKFGDDQLGQDGLFAKYHRDYTTTAGGAPANPTENTPPSEIGTGHTGPSGPDGKPSNNNSDIIGNSGIPFGQPGENISGIGQAAGYDKTKTPMPSGKGAGEDKSNTYRSDYTHYSAAAGAKTYSNAAGN